MKHIFKKSALLCSFALLGAYASVSHAQDCVGEIITPPAGLVPATDDALLASTIGAPSKGALCKGKVFVAEKPVTVYRVWDASKSFTLYGRWWSFDLPVGPRDQYQVDNVICPEWSPLNKMSSCTIKVGTKVVVGPGQSAQCSDRLIPASAVNQVNIPNDSRNNVLFVENCSEGVAWPN
jgi:hypothetical protein